MSNHMAKSVICSPAMTSTATRTMVARRDRVAEDPQDELDEAEEEADDEHQHAEDVEEDERVEVADDVLLPHPPPEALERSQEMRGTTERRRMPDRSPTS